MSLPLYSVGYAGLVLTHCRRGELPKVGISGRKDRWGPFWRLTQYSLKEHAAVAGEGRREGKGERKDGTEGNILIPKG